MSRRSDREGVGRSELQRRRNLECDPENHLNAKGWYVPHLSWEGWEELNSAIYALRCVIIWKKIAQPLKKAPLYRKDGTLSRDELHRGSTCIRIESDMRSFHAHMNRTRQCAKPNLPG